MSESNPSQKLKFLNTNSDLPLRSIDGVRVHFQEDKKGNLEMFIAIEEYTSQDSLKKSFPFIGEWRERLRIWQGYIPGDSNTFWLSKVDEAKNDGLSYKNISGIFNELIKKEILDYIEYAKELRKVSTSFKTFGDYQYWWVQYILRRWPNERNTYIMGMLNLTESILQIFNIPESDQELIIHNLILELMENPNTLLEQYPIEGNKLREKHRYWKKKLAQYPILRNEVTSTKNYRYPLENFPHFPLNRFDDNISQELKQIPWNENWILKPLQLKQVIQKNFKSA